MPPQRLWIQFTPLGRGATHAGQSGQWEIQSRLTPARYLDAAGRPSERGPRSRIWGSDGVPGLHHKHGHPHQGLLQHTLLHLCHPLGQRCQSGGRGCTLIRWNQVNAIVRASASAPWDTPGPVGCGQPQSTRKASAHTWPGSSFPLNLPPNCQLPVHPGKGMTLAHFCSNSVAKPPGTQTADCTGTCPHKDTPERLV